MAVGRGRHRRCRRMCEATIFLPVVVGVVAVREPGLGFSRAEILSPLFYPVHSGARLLCGDTHGMVAALLLPSADAPLYRPRAPDPCTARPRIVLGVGALSAGR